MQIVRVAASINWARFQGLIDFIRVYGRITEKGLRAARFKYLNDRNTLYLFKSSRRGAKRMDYLPAICHLSEIAREKFYTDLDTRSKGDKAESTRWHDI